MEEVLLVITLVMILTGLYLFVEGRKRGLYNTLAWSLFPILHGFHEFTEYVIINYIPSIFLEKIEIFIAISSSLVLLTAVIEFNGVFSEPVGKVTGLISTIILGALIFIMPDSIFESLEEDIINYVILQTTLFRFTQGFILIWISIIFLLITDIYAIHLDKQEKFKLPEKVHIASLTLMFALLVYSIFEGFESTNSVFVFLRSITLAIVILVPLFVLLTFDIGLQKLLVIDSSGMLIHVHNFKTKGDVEEFSNKDVLSAGFIAAINMYATEVLEKGKAMTVNTRGLYFSLVQVENLLIVTTSRFYTTALEKALNSFVSRIENELTSKKDIKEIITKDLIKEYFESIS